MKKIIYSSLFFLIIISSVTSCDIMFGHKEPDFISYPLAMRFLDSSNNDLAEGIGLESEESSNGNIEWGIVKHNLYNLEVVASPPCEDVIASINSHYIPDYPRLEMKKLDGHNYFLFGYSLGVNECSNEKVLTYKIKCPYIFGNEEVHEFVTYWEIPKIKKGFTDAKCVRVELAGKTFIPSASLADDYLYQVVIKLDEKQTTN